VFDVFPALAGEVIFVDDGSGDRSFDELMEIYQEFPDRAKIIKLTRNFGQVRALYAGFRYAEGKCVITMSADEQDPVELIGSMLSAFFAEGYQIVLCARMGRDESVYRITTSKIFYGLIRRLSFPNMPKGGFDFVLISRKVLNILLRNNEVHPFLQGQILYTGYKPKIIEYHRLERKVGRSRWTFGKKFTYLLDGVLSYSYFPVRVMSGVGMIAAMLGFLYAIVVFVSKLVRGNPVQGWAPLMIVILVIGGLQMLMLGMIGEYLWRTLAQVRDGPPFIIEDVYGGEIFDPQAPLPGDTGAGDRTNAE